MLRTLTLSLILCLLLFACSEQLGERRTYVLTTGTTSGTFYPVGVALSTIVSAKEEAAFSLTSISSAGSLENIRLLHDNEAQFALVICIFGPWALDGSGPFRKPYKNIRSISSMWPNVEHFVLRSDLVSDRDKHHIIRIQPA